MRITIADGHYEKSQQLREHRNFVIEMIPARCTTLHAYDMGCDCGVNGANETNCHFSIFGRPEWTKAWERGKADAEAGHSPESSSVRSCRVCDCTNDDCEST